MPLSARTLIRLSCWIPHERLTEFDDVYEQQLVPLLRRHGFEVSSEQGRMSPQGIVSRLLECQTPAEALNKWQVFRKDPAAVEGLRRVGALFGTTQSDGLIRHEFSFYEVPAGPGAVMPAGRGTQKQAGAGTGHWCTYDATDGMTSGSVHSILQDRAGILWVGTKGGVSQYDGYAWTAFTETDGLAYNHVWSILQDRGGALWVATAGGVSRYDEQTWTTFTTDNGLVSDDVRSILQDRVGTLWFGTWGGLSRYDGQAWTTFTTDDGLASNHVSSIVQDQSGRFWVGTEGGLSRYDGQTWTTFTTVDGLAGNIVVSLLEDREGQLWVGTEGGLSRCDGQTWTTFTTAAGLAANRVNTIFQDQTGTLWFGTDSGISRYDGHTWATFTEDASVLASDVVNAILEDREGQFWFGTFCGVSRYDGQTWTTFTTAAGLAGNIAVSLLEDRAGMFWVGTYGGGVSRYDGQTWTTFTTVDGLAGNIAVSLLEDRAGMLWVGTTGGVSRYDGQTWTTFTIADGLAGNTVWSLFQDRAGTLWVGTIGGGVSRYDGQTWTTFTIADGLGGNNAYAILEDRAGTLWVGTNGGASRYDGQAWTTFTPHDGRAGNKVTSLLEDRAGQLWIGTEGGGVSRYDGQTWITFTTHDGLADTMVRSLFQDRAGTLWVGTLGGGVSRYDGQVFQTMIRPDGLAGNNVYAILQDQTGAFWFGTNKGVTRYRLPAPSPPHVIIDAVVSDRRYTGVTVLAIPASVRLIAFEFHGQSFKTRPEAMMYRYRLTGYDHDWQITRARRVEYQDLPRGRHTFEVQAVDRDLVYSVTPATIDIRIHEFVAQRKQERVVDQVRAEIARMQTSADLDRITAMIREGLRTLEVPLRRFGVIIVDEQAKRMRITLMNPLGVGLGELDLPSDRFGISQEVVTHWRKRLRYVTRWDRQTFLEWLEFLQAQGQPIERQRFLDGKAPPEALHLHFVPFVQGMLYVGSETPLSETDVSLVETLANAFAVAYARYLDFRQSEAQNRELAAANARLQELDQLKSALISHVSHELRTPLTAIKRAVDNLLEGIGGELTEKQQYSLSRVQANTNRLDRLIADLLDLARVEAGQLQLTLMKVSVEEVAQDVIQALQPQAMEQNITLALQVKQPVVLAWADPTRVHQILVNLVTNALKLTRSGGRVEVRVIQDAERVCVVVQNTGEGIPASELEGMFEPFSQVGDAEIVRGESGLGLSIAKRLAELQGGRIEVRSVAGQGNEFRCTLLVAEKAAKRRKGKRQPPQEGELR
ncbi:MAG: hypothetical protein HY710_04100 [Candidatus Latescibacteria bacterium]|nr:hypothetical protein [Candidatus Latescibacterota bacterium]